LILHGIEVAAEANNFDSLADNGAELTIVVMFPVNRRPSSVVLPGR
jgi:hypothetical protein